MRILHKYTCQINIGTGKMTSYSNVLYGDLRFKFLIFLFFLFFLNPSAFSNMNGSVRSPVCDPAALREELMFLHLSPDIKNNGDFKKNVLAVYGESIWTLAKTAHPYLKEKKKALDVDTVFWLFNIISVQHHRYLKEMYYPFTRWPTGLNKEEETFKLIISDLISSSIKGSLGSKLLFHNKAVYAGFIHYAKHPIRGKKKTEELFQDIMSRYYPNINTITSVKWAKIFYESLFEPMKVNYSTMFRPKNKSYAPTVEIMGHGHPKHLAVFSPDLEKIIFSELVHSLVEKKILTPNAKIKLTSCNSACAVVPRLPYETDEIIKKFMNKTLQDEIWGGIASSLYHLREEIDKQYPQHRGDVVGYMGFVTFGMVDALHLDGKSRLSYGAAVENKHGEKIDFNRDEMSKTLPKTKVTQG